MSLVELSVLYTGYRWWPFATHSVYIRALDKLCYLLLTSCLARRWRWRRRELPVGYSRLTTRLLLLILLMQLVLLSDPTSSNHQFHFIQHCSYYNAVRRYAGACTNGCLFCAHLVGALLLQFQIIQWCPDEDELCSNMIEDHICKVVRERERPESRQKRDERDRLR